MLTEEAFHKRRWGRFPNLAQFVSANQPSLKWTGPTSVSSNIFNQVDDLLHVYALVADRHDEIRKQCFKADDHGLRHDMESLSKHLKMMSKFFNDASDNVNKVIFG